MSKRQMLGALKAQHEALKKEFESKLQALENKIKELEPKEIPERAGVFLVRQLDNQELVLVIRNRDSLGDNGSASVIYPRFSLQFNIKVVREKFSLVKELYLEELA